MQVYEGVGVARDRAQESPDTRVEGEVGEVERLECTARLQRRLEGSVIPYEGPSEPEDASPPDRRRWGSTHDEQYVNPSDRKRGGGSGNLRKTTKSWGPKCKRGALGT